MSSSPASFKDAPEVPGAQLTLVDAFMVPPFIVPPLSVLIKIPVAAANELAT